MVRTIALVVGLLGVVALGAIVFSGTGGSDALTLPPIIVGTTTEPALVKPAVQIKPAADVGTTTASFNGVVMPNGGLTTYWFEYSSDPDIGAVLMRVTPHIALATTTGKITVTVDALNLMPSTTYYYRLAAQSPGGVARSESQSFRTK
ncbi:MAG TPA: hypothetical protein VFP46_01105 [Candidatus Paceibacterota bacterium]|nr:hypothetical protein [Candidatus Paceibacterota bacterium]